MPSPETQSMRFYGRRRTTRVLTATALWSVLALGLIAIGVLESGTAQFLVEIAAVVFLVLFTLMYPVLGFLMYSPRTVASHIAVDTSGAASALILRQSCSILFASVIQISFFTAIFVALTLDAYDPGDRISGWALVLTVACGWQTGYFIFILIRRIRPGYIAIRHDGIHIADHATDTWIPWHSTSLPLLVRDPLYALIAVHPNTGARCTSRVPAPWRTIDDRERFDLHASPTRPPGRYARVDYRRFRIAPELLEAALNHYLKHPELRDELHNPDAVAHIVTQLRAHAPGPLWRSHKTPVHVPILHSAGTTTDKNL